MKVIYVFKLIIVILIFSFPAVVFAHSGNTDSKGCHYVRKTGEYHCHNIKVAKTNAKSSSRK